MLGFVLRHLLTLQGLNVLLFQAQIFFLMHICDLNSTLEIFSISSFYYPMLNQSYVTLLNS